MDAGVVGTRLRLLTIGASSTNDPRYSHYLPHDAHSRTFVGKENVHENRVKPCATPENRQLTATISFICHVSLHFRNGSHCIVRVVFSVRLGRVLGLFKRICPSALKVPSLRLLSFPPRYRDLLTSATSFSDPYLGI
jgi:hypothetical protein